MRGLPGSGKTETARAVAGDDGLVLSAPISWDGYIEALLAGVSKIVLDDCHPRFSDMGPYIDEALERDYTIVLTYSHLEDAWSIDACALRSDKSCEELESLLKEFEFEFDF